MDINIKERLEMCWCFLRHLATRFVADGCKESAAALTYMSLFAIVPLMTLMYSMFSLIPAFQGLSNQVEQLIFNNFMPQSGAEIQKYLQEFSTQARSLSAVGAIILVVTSYLMLSNIEKTFNKIWNAPGGRRGLSSFLLYWGILSLGPLLLGIGLMMRTYLLSFQLLVHEVDSLGVTAILFNYLPILFTWVTFSLLFVAVPNCRVSVRYCIIGGLASTLCFELAKYAFSSYIGHSSYTTVYGAFAIVPIFLIWIYLMWMIVLGGAELVRSLETFKNVWRGYNYPGMVAATMVLWHCWQKQQRGNAISDNDIVKAGIEEQHWRHLRNLMIKNRILTVSNNDHYVLTRDIHSLPLIEIANLGHGLSTALPRENHRVTENLKNYPWYEPFAALLQQANQQFEDTLSPSVADIFNGGKHMAETSDSTPHV